MSKTLSHKFPYLTGNTEMANLIRNKDWSQTSLGDAERWPQSLTTALSILLHSKFPMFLFWGRDLNSFYNDAYRPSFGKEGMHPSILGMPAEEAWKDIWHIVKKFPEQVLTTGEATWQEDMLIPIYRNGQNEDVYWTFSHSPVYDRAGKIEGIFVMCMETTAKVNAIKKQDEYSQQLSGLLKQAPAAIALLEGPEHKFILANSLYQKVYNRTEAQLMGKTVREVFPELEGQGIYELFAKIFTTGEAFSSDVYPASWKKDGVEITNGFFNFVAQPITSNTGEVLSILIHATDVTEQVKAKQAIEDSQERLKNFSIELEKQVEKRTEELEAANELFENKNIELLRLNKELQSFAYISSHDLQEPLRKIQTFASRILEKEQHNLSAYGRDSFARMQDAAKRMQILIDDLLAYSRTSTGIRNFEMYNLDLIVQEVLEDLRDDLREKNASVTVTRSCKAPIIVFQFRQLLYNLIGNSLKFSQENVAPIITISCEIVNGDRISVPQIDAAAKYCQIIIADNGIGFDPQYGEKIFEVFQRLHTSQQYAGTGIGLSIVKKIVENHNGFILANSEIRKGATFTIYLPQP